LFVAKSFTEVFHDGREVAEKVAFGVGVLENILRGCEKQKGCDELIFLADVAIPIPDAFGDLLQFSGKSVGETASFAAWGGPDERREFGGFDVICHACS